MKYWRRLTESTRTGLAAFLCFTFFLVTYSSTSHASANASDEVAVFRTGVTIFTEGHLYIDDLWKLQHITPIGIKGIGDHLYSKYFPGNALCAGFIYLLTAKQNDRPYISDNPIYNKFELAPSEFGARIALRLNALLGAVGMAVLFLFLKKHYRLDAAAVTVLLIGLTTDWWNESRMFYSEIGAGAFLITSLYFADNDNPYLCSLFLAISMLFRPTNLIAIPVWMYAVWKKNWKAVLSGIFIAGGLAFLALYNYARFYSFTNFGYGNEGFTTPILTGLMGIFLSPGHSLFIYSPITILAITGCRLLYKTNKPLMLATLTTTLGYILLVAMWGTWFGGTVWGSRLVVPILPMLGILIGPVINGLFANPDKRLMAVVVLLGILGLCIQILTIAQAPAYAFREYTRNAYATQDDVVWSITKNWLALEIKNLANWNICHLDSYNLRNLFPQCGP